MAEIDEIVSKIIDKIEENNEREWDEIWPDYERNEHGYVNGYDSYSRKAKNKVKTVGYKADLGGTRIFVGRTYRGDACNKNFLDEYLMDIGNGCIVSSKQLKEGTTERIKGIYTKAKTLYKQQEEEKIKKRHEDQFIKRARKALDGIERNR